MSDPLPNTAIISLNDLAREFAAVVEGIEADLASEGLAQELPAEAVADIEASLAAEGQESTLAKRDRLAELIYAFENSEARKRELVRRVEGSARHDHAMAERLKWSLLTYMQIKQIAKISGEVVKFGRAKLPAKMIVKDETLVPDEYFDTEIVTTRVLNKERLWAALEAGTEVPGAHIEKDRERLSIR